MAQVKNPNNMRVQNGKVNGAKPIESHSWSFDKVSKEDLNKNQWPFKVIRDRKKSSRMDIRSITELKRSFEGTSYNLNDCDKEYGRFVYLANKLVKNHKDKINKITHLLFTYNTVYFSMGDPNNIYTVNFYEGPSNPNKLCNTILYRSKYYETKIKESFNLYKDSNDSKYVELLRNYVEKYIECCQNLSVINSSKPMVDILSYEAFTFSSLKYVFFIPYPSNFVAFDLVNYFYREFIRKNGIEVTNEINNEVENLKYCELNYECEAYKGYFKKLESMGLSTSIIKAYYLDVKKQNLDVSDIKMFFTLKDLTGNPLSESVSIYTSKKYLEDAQRKINEDFEKIEEAKKKIEKETLNRNNNLKVLIQRNNRIVWILDKICSLGYNTDKLLEKLKSTNSSEYNIWGKNYESEKFLSRLNAIYEHMHKDKKIEERLNLSEILNVFPSFYKRVSEYLSSEENEIKIYQLSEEDIRYFTKRYMPQVLNDGRRTLKSMGCDLKTLDGIENYKKLLEEVEKDVISVLECILGIHFGVIGEYFCRFGKKGLFLMDSKLFKCMLTPSMEIVTTHNIEIIYNLAFYMIHFDKSKLENVSENGVESYSPENRTMVMGELEYFVGEVLRYIATGKVSSSEGLYIMKKEGKTFEDEVKNILLVCDQINKFIIQYLDI